MSAVLNRQRYKEREMLENVQKFGLGYCDLPTMLWNISVFLRVLTLNIDKRNTKRIPIFFYLLTTVFALCYFYVYLFSMVWFVYVRYPITGDVIAAVVVFSLGIASEIGICKLAYMFFSIKSINELVENYLKCDSLVLHGSRFNKNLMKYLRNVKRRALIFWAVIIGNGVAYIAKPIIMPGRHFMEDMYIVYGLEPMYESPNYEIAFTVMVAGVCVCCYLPANITAFFIVIAGYTESQMLALSEELTMLWSDAEILYVKNAQNIQKDENIISKVDFMNNFIHARLKEIVQRHTMNLNLLRRLEKVIRGPLAIEFLILVVALIAELLAGLEKTYLEVPFALMQVAMDCLNGQRLLDASVVFENAVYNCNWENFNQRNMKTVLLMLRIGQRPLDLTAGGVSRLNFACLMSVFRSIYSAYTTLRKIV